MRVRFESGDRVRDLDDRVGQVVAPTGEGVLVEWLDDGSSSLIDENELTAASDELWRRAMRARRG